MGLGVLVAGIAGIPAIIGSGLQGGARLLDQKAPERAQLDGIGKTLQIASMNLWLPVLPSALTLVPLARRTLEQFSPASAFKEPLQMLERYLDGAAKVTNSIIMTCLALASSGWVAAFIIGTSVGGTSYMLWRSDELALAESSRKLPRRAPA